MATDYLALGMGLTFVCGLAFTVLAVDSEMIVRAIFYEMFGSIAWLSTAYLFWSCGTEIIVGIPWLFVALALILFIMLLIDGIQALNVWRRMRRGW